MINKITHPTGDRETPHDTWLENQRIITDEIYETLINVRREDSSVEEFDFDEIPEHIPLPLKPRDEKYKDENLSGLRKLWRYGVLDEEPDF